MFEDSVTSRSPIRGWFAEFEKLAKTFDPFAQERLRIMLRKGFLPLALVYDQPALPGSTFAEQIVSDKLFLAYKPFGDSLDYERGTEEFLNFLRNLLRSCYYIDRPERHAAFISISRRWEDCQPSLVKNHSGENCPESSRDISEKSGANGSLRIPILVPLKSEQ